LAQALSYRTNELYTPQQIAADPFNFGSYVGADGNTYLTRSGFGREFPTNNRGNKNNNDIYMVTSVRLTYILGATFHKAKFR
jgi:hypothetical protein